MKCNRKLRAAGPRRRRSLSPGVAQLKMGPSRRPFGIRLASLCNRIAQTCASVSCSTQESMPAMTAALVAARLGQRPKTNGGWEAFVHTPILGEHKTNVNIPGTLRFSCDRGRPTLVPGVIQLWTDKANRSIGNPLGRFSRGREPLLETGAGRA